MDDAGVQNHIEELVAEEHRLLEGHRESGLSEADHKRLAEVKVELDRFWDLLRQRRAHEEFQQGAQGRREEKMRLKHQQHQARLALKMERDRLWREKQRAD